MKSSRGLAAGALLCLALPVQIAASAPTFCSTGTQTDFTNMAAAGTATGTIQSYTAPSTQVAIRASGAQGGGPTGGLGAQVASTFTVTAGQTLCAIVGGQGGTAFNGAYGGGGGSFVYAISSGTCASNIGNVTDMGTAPNLLIAAGGGGGQYFSDVTAGGAGAVPTGAGAAGASAGGAGLGGGGAAGGVNGNGGGAIFNSGGGGGLATDGAMANGVQGGFALIHGANGGVSGSYTNGGFGGGGASATPGGGGGGYNGGGAGGAGTLGGGGGGGSFSAATLDAVNTTSGVQSGNGLVSFCVIPTPAAVPTLTWWAQLGLVLAICIGGLAVLQKPRRPSKFFS